MEVQPQLNQLTQFWLSQLNQMHQFNQIVNQSNGDDSSSGGGGDAAATAAATAADEETTNTNVSSDVHNVSYSACQPLLHQQFVQNFDFNRFASQLFNQTNENFLPALLKRGANLSQAQSTTAAQQKQQQNALVPPTPPRTPITPSAQHQQVTHSLTYSFIHSFTRFLSPALIYLSFAPSLYATYFRLLIFYLLLSHIFLWSLFSLNLLLHNLLDHTLRVFSVTLRLFEIQTSEYILYTLSRIRCLISIFFVCI